MRKELGPARITVIVDGSSDRVGRDVVGERVARVVGGLQQQHREALRVIVGSNRTETETETETVEETPPSSALAPPLSPSPSPSPSSPCRTTPRIASGKLQNRVDVSKLRLSCYGFHRQWWQRWPTDMLGPHWVYRRRRQLLKKTRCWTPGEHMVVGLAKRLQRIEQRIRNITRKHEILRYEKVAEKYMQWQNHLREQMMIRRWGTRRNAELDREKRRDSVRLACLRRRRDDLARLVG